LISTDLTRAFPGARPAGALRASKTAILPFCRIRPVRPLRHLSAGG